MSTILPTSTANAQSTTALTPPPSSVMDIITAESLDSVLSPNCSVTEYIKNILGFLREHALQHQISLMDALDMLQVVNFYRLKQSTLFQHEALCVEVKYANNTHYIVFERMLGLSRFGPLLGQPSLESCSFWLSCVLFSEPIPSLNGASFMESISLFLVDFLAGLTDSIKAVTGLRIPANDRVRTIDSRIADQEKLETGFKISTPLIVVALLAINVHLHSSSYSLYHEQCYWFSNLMYAVVVKRFNPQPAPLPTSQDDNINGTWRDIQIIEIEEKLVDMINEMFGRELLRIDEICEIFTKNISEHPARGGGSSTQAVRRDE